MKDLDFGMMSDAGEDMIYDLVKLANKFMLNDSTVNAMLLAISNEEVYAEATDTVVRERVFAALGRQP